MPTLVIREGRLLDPASHVDRVADILIHDGCIEKVAEKLRAPSDATQIDARKCWVTPGLIELSCEPGEPGREDRETFRSLLEAAARGGFAQIALEPNTLPVHDEPAITSWLLALAHAPTLRPSKRSRPQLLPMGALSKALGGQEQSDAGELRAAGVRALSDGGVASDFSFLRRALEYAVSHDLPVHLSACVDTRANEGRSAARVGLRTQHRHEEVARVREACTLAQVTGARVHLSAISTEESLAALTGGGSQNATTAAIAVCNLFDHDAQLAEYDATSKLSPPLRTERDCRALRTALSSSETLTLSARHRPRTYSEMRSTYDEATGGRSTLETAVARSLELVHEHGLAPLAWARCWTLNPARALGLDLPSLALGSPAQMTIIDPEQTWTVSVDQLASRGHNIPPSLSSLRGRVTHTIVAGGVAFELC